MFTRSWLTTLAALMILGTTTRAGVYYSGETYAELPSQWRGFLLDQRMLRTIAIKPVGSAPNPSRLRYEEAVAKLEKKARDDNLNADECADLGALYIRLGDSGKAVELLRKAQRDFESHFRILANLGTAWQLQGDLDQAILCLREAVRLAPGKHQRAEELHLKLVRLRTEEPKGGQELDNLFGVQYRADGGGYEPGRLAEAQSKKLPGDAVAQLQQLALWLPADGRLLWQLAEIANAYGDVQIAASIMDGCVGEFSLRSEELRNHRRVLRAAADELKKNNPPTKNEHESHLTGLKARSSRPFLARLDLEELPTVKAEGLNSLLWSILNETKVDRKLKPTFPKYLQELDGKQVVLMGYMQLLGESTECSNFLLIEYPVGCWYCEMPDIIGMVQVEMPSGKVFSYTRSSVRIEGTLTLNPVDPENFLYTIQKARVTEVE